MLPMPGDRKGEAPHVEASTAARGWLSQTPARSDREPGPGYILEVGGVRPIVEARPPTIINGKPVQDWVSQARALFETLDKSRAAIASGEVLEETFADAAE